MLSYITTISLLQLPLCWKVYVDTHRHVAHKSLRKNWDLENTG